MRALFLSLLLALCATPVISQNRLAVSQTESSPEEIDEEDEPETTVGRAGAFFERMEYARAEMQARRDFARMPSEESARILYYSLRFEGYDLEAEDFRRKHPDYTFAIAPARKGFESIYADAGPRISANDAADNVLFGDAGAFIRPGPRLRLWQSLTYLRQDHDLGSFNQYEYFGSLGIHLGRGWYVQPALHYAYVSFRFVVEDTAHVNYTTSYPLDNNDTLVYKTSAVQQITTTIPGTSHFVHLATPLIKHLGAFEAEVEPSLHFEPTRSSILTTYVATGTTDSFENNRLKGTKPYSETGGSSTDTAFRVLIIQAGASIACRIPVPGEPVTLRAGAWYLRSDEGASAMAYHASASVRCSKSLRLYLTWLSKGNLPFALRSEGQYFNFNDPIRTRAGISFYLFPLRHLSPIVTYQYEHDTRLQDNATLVYHSVYLSLKYSF